MNLFGGLFAGLFGTDEGKERSVDPDDGLKADLERAWDEVQRLAREEVSKREAEASSEDQGEKTQAQHEKARGELWESILALHKKLNTGLDEETVSRLERVFANASGEASGPCRGRSQSLGSDLSGERLLAMAPDSTMRGWGGTSPTAVRRRAGTLAVAKRRIGRSP